MDFCYNHVTKLHCEENPMRMRKKTNLVPRMEACSEYWIREPETYKGHWRELMLSVPGHITPTERPHSAQPTRPKKGMGERAAKR